MREVCSWCEKDFGETKADETSGEAISPTICVDCLRDIFAQPTGEPLRRFLKRLVAPVLVVSGAGRILTANVPVLDLLGKDLPDIAGLPGGDVFECTYARLPEGCGNTVHCSGCTIRRRVAETFETGKRFTRVPAHLRPADPSAPGRIELTISTEKVEGVVLLRIDAFGGPQA
ncbi:MAG: hypothetical protein ACYS9X_04140 [Planctomycetota bacterium]|jgi:hypothetical protein